MSSRFRALAARLAARLVHRPATAEPALSATTREPRRLGMHLYQTADAVRLSCQECGGATWMRLVQDALEDGWDVRADDAVVVCPAHRLPDSPPIPEPFRPTQEQVETARQFLTANASDIEQSWAMTIMTLYRRRGTREAPKPIDKSVETAATAQRTRSADVVPARHTTSP